MTRRISLRPRAEQDIADAIDWYDLQRDGLGAEFLSAVGSSFEILADNPLQYSVFRGEIRRARMRRFPYVLFYAASAEEIVILRCIHNRRDPAEWPPES